MARAISECPVCHSKDLKQDFATPVEHFPTRRMGGEHTNRAPILDGCHCNGCGTRLVFNKASECLACHGTGEFEYKTYLSGVTPLRTRKEKCPVCNGSGQI